MDSENLSKFILPDVQARLLTTNCTQNMEASDESADFSKRAKGGIGMWNEDEEEEWRSEVTYIEQEIFV